VGCGLPRDSRRLVAERGVSPASDSSKVRTFVVDAVDDVLDRLRVHGAALVGEVAQYGDIYRYCYVRGPDGIIIGLVEELR
jgi:predicted enzyme related to lactoylglutathione lyase